MKQLLVLGAGLIGARHAQAIKAHRECNLVGVVEPNQNLYRDADTTFFSDISQVTAPVDGVIIATPTNLHCENGIYAARKGWDILIEKPVTASLEQAKELSQVIQESGIASLVGHHRRYHPSVQALKSLVTGKKIGTAVTASMIWAMRKPDAYFEQNWRSTEGSPVMINIVHDLDLLRFVFGDIAKITGFGSSLIRNQNRVESGAAAILFETGMTASISFADTTPSPWGFEAGTGENPNIATSGQDMLWITGTEGGISFPSMTQWGGAADWSEAPTPRKLKIATAVPLQQQLQHFLDVMAGTAEPLISVFDATKTLANTLELETLFAQQIEPI